MSEQNPWKKLSSREVYRNPWIRVREDEVIRPDGKRGIYGVVETRIATGVVALSDDNQVYLVGQYRYPTDEYSWEIIEGGAEESETPLAAVQRELREEAGLEAAWWMQLGEECHLSNCFSAERAYLYMARGLRQVGAQPDGTEILQVKCLPFSECMAMAERGAIKDAMSLLALHRAERFLIGRCVSGGGRFSSNPGL